MDQKQISALVDAEIARRRTAKLLDSPKAKSWWDTFLRHPMTLAVITFVFTFGVGALYDSVLKKREDDRIAEKRKIAAARELEQESIAKLNGIVTLAFERITWGGMLASSVKRSNAAEARARKDAYDEAFARWNVGLPINFQTLKTLTLDEERFDIYQRAITKSLLPFFKINDACVTNAYYKFIAHDQPYFDPPAKYDCRTSQQKTASGQTDTGLEDWFETVNKANTTLRECVQAIQSSMLSEIRAIRKHTISNRSEDISSVDTNSNDRTEGSELATLRTSAASDLQEYCPPPTSAIDERRDTSDKFVTEEKQ